MTNLQNFSEEIWKDISVFDGEYQVSNIGRVRSFCKNAEGYILKTRITKHGYEDIPLRKRTEKKIKQYMVHILVATAFIPNNQNKPFVNHINGKKSDNYALNLEWVTSRENALHSYKIGLSKPLRKKVIQKDLNGNFVKEWESTYATEKGGFLRPYISLCINGKKKNYKGFIWILKDID